MTDPGAFCREVETYLCRKNGGHLVRIVGPAFDRVRGWAESGVPIQVVTQGIDRKLERYHAAGRSRRPLRIEHCEADVLDAFHAWRRAVGVTAMATGGPATGSSAAQDDTPPSRGASLPRHIDRVVTQATTLLALAEGAPGLHTALETLVAAVDALRQEARGARGAARAACVDRLAEVDRVFMADARRAAGTMLDALQASADRELAPFKPRMTDGVYAKARSAAADRLLRERLRLPTVRFG